MVIGNGMVAKSFYHFKERNDVVIFASGVSNSKSAVASEFEREKQLLHKVISENLEKKIIYFSTFNLYDPKEQNSPYCLHKLDMENFIALNVNNYTIFRLGHVAGKSANDFTILSFLYNAIKDNTKFNLWKYASRNIIDIDDISTICTYIINNSLFKSRVLNICNSVNTSIIEIVGVLEDILKKKGDYTVILEGGSPIVDNSDILKIAKNLNIDFDKKYVPNVIEKYYGKL
jgi:nucleoside-diphosphate-sugar epimerase